MVEKMVVVSNENKKWYTRWWAFVLFALLVIIFTFVPMFIYQFVKTYTEVKSGTYVYMADINSPPPYDMQQVISETAPFFGAENPKVTIVEFGDFNCSKCLESSSILRELLLKHADSVRLYWRNLPLLSQSSYELAIAGVCAARQQKFWQAHDVFFAQQGKLTNQEQIDDLLVSLGLSKNKLAACRNSKLTEAEIKKDYFLAKDLQLQGTPTFFVNGYMLQGVIPLDYWEVLIDKLSNIYDKKNATN